MTKIWTRTALFAAIALYALVLGDGPLTGQEKTPDKPAAKPAAANADAAQDTTAKEPKARKKPAGRLPFHFADVVTGEQRDKIYEVQSSYNTQIAELRMQIEELISERDREVDAVLSTEQLATVAKKRAEAKAAREAARAAARGAKLQTKSE